MSEEIRTATLRIEAPTDTVFALLADPGRHAAVEGTGWVREPVETEPLSAVGQVFRMGMYSGGEYETVNQVYVLDAPRTIGWGTGNFDADGNVNLGGWTWRYDLAPAGPASTDVTLTYDWSQVGSSWRKRIPFPPFAEDYLANSLQHLADLARG